MVPVEKVIQKVVNEFEFVVIPGLGALLSRQIPASYHADNELFTPPSKKLAFNEFVKLDDGLLANYIAYQEHISHHEAITYIKSYVDKLKHSLHEQGNAHIPGVGGFVYNEEGKLVFDSETKTYFKDEWYGFHEIAAKQVEPALHGLGIKVSDVDHYLVGEDEGSGTFRGNRWKAWTAAASFIVVAGFLSYFYVSGTNVANYGSLNPFGNIFAEKKSNSVSEPLKPSTTILATIIPEDSTVVPLDSAAFDSAYVEYKGVNTGVTTYDETAQNMYHVIAGAFKGSKQAGVLLKEMKAKGYDAAFIIPAARDNHKFKVAVGSFHTEAEAKLGAVELKSVIGEFGWVYHRK